VAGDPQRLGLYLSDCRSQVQDEIRALIPADRADTGGLYRLMLDYPLREGKGLRPALAMATCRGLGGPLDAVLRTAATLELFHNAFLVHDDVEDGSELRRHRETLHQLHGVPIAVNVGDGMLALALRPLLENVERVGLGPALNVLDVVTTMARESAEGQALELSWVQENRWDQGDRDYVRMVYKKTAVYSFVTPAVVGALCARAQAQVRAALSRFAVPLGVAFQIADDLLNLAGQEAVIGKESCGDLWEGKHTLILMHALRTAGGPERQRAIALLGQPRADKDAAEVDWLLNLVHRQDSLAYARDVARRYARRAAVSFAGLARWFGDSVHRDFLEDLVDYVVDRTR